MLLYTVRTSYILPAMTDFLPFQHLTIFFWFRVFLPTIQFVNCPTTTTYLCWLCHSPLPNKKDYFICLLTVASLSTTMWVFSLAISHGMHLVVPTHPSFFWGVCHPSRTLPPKEYEREPQNRLSFSPLPNHTLFYLWLITHHSCIGWVQVCSAQTFRMLHFLCTLKVCLLLMRLPLFEGSSVHSILYWLAPFKGWALLDCGFSPFQPILCSFHSLVVIPTIPLYCSCRGVI